MKRPSYLIPAAIAACAMAFVSTANADGVETSKPSSPPPAEGPNTDLMGIGIVTLALPYFASVAVATSNTGHDNLYIPVAGPWLDLADRPSCGGGGSSHCSDMEPLNKFLLVGDGILQGIGALEVLAGLVSSTPYDKPAHASAPSGPSIHVAPTRVGRTGYGVGAVGTF